MSAAITLSDEQRKSFIRDGYVVLPGAVPADIVNKAVTFIDQAYADGRFDLSGDRRRGSAHPAPVFHYDVRTSPLVTDLVYKSGLLKAAEQLLGDGNAVIRDEWQPIGQIAYSEPNELYVQQGMSKHEPHRADRWHVDSGAGQYAVLGTDFAFLIGMALSPGQHIDENRGQYTVWPGSHYITHPALSEIIFSSPSERVMEKFRASSLDCGQPQRVLLHAGDAFFAHQRLAHAAGINLWDVVRRNVYFRVKHARFQDLAYRLLRSPTPWTGFSGLQDLLPQGSTSFGNGTPEYNSTRMRRILGARSVASSLPEEKRRKLSLTRAQMETFMRDGYLVLRDIVAPELVHIANEFLSKAYAEGSFHETNWKQLGSSVPQLTFTKAVRRAPQVTDLYLKSGLVDLSEQLLGKGNIMVQRNRGQVSFGCTSDIFVNQGMSISAPYPKDRWNIDGGMDKYEVFGADYFLLVGIALSEGQDVDENRGQFTVWPGSHCRTHSMLSEIIRGVFRLITSLPVLYKGGNRDDLHTERWAGRIDCGNPVRLLLNPGDIFIAHQRLAHASGINLTNEIAKIVLFRILHVDLDDILPLFARSQTPFYGFEGLDGISTEKVSRG